MEFHHRWAATALFMTALFGISTAPAQAADYTITDLGTLPGDTNSVASGINGNGQVVGYSDTGSFDNHAFLYSKGSMTDTNRRSS